MCECHTLPPPCLLPHVLRHAHASKEMKKPFKADNTEKEAISFALNHCFDSFSTDIQRFAVIPKARGASRYDCAVRAPSPRACAIFPPQTRFYSRVAPEISLRRHPQGASA